MNISWLVVGAMIVSILYGYITHKNIGPMTAGFAFLFGCGILRLSPRKLLSFIPVSTLFRVFAITFFFGFPINNGTISVLTKKILYRIRGHSGLLIPGLFFLALSQHCQEQELPPQLLWLLWLSY